MWSRTYCCCAVPLYNSGIYAIISQFFIVSLVTGVLAFAAPKIVAIAIPSWGPFAFGAACILVAVIQLVGFLGVYRERPTLFKNYARLNAALVSIALLLAVAFIALSASRHSSAVTRCEEAFSTQVGNTTSTAATAVQAGSQICNIWTWVQVGIMGLLFLIVAVCEIYFLMYQSIYASEQKLDHARYENVVEQAAEEIRQSGIWDSSRSSNEFLPPGQPGYSHVRNGSGLRNEIRDEDYDDDDGGRRHDRGLQEDEGFDPRYASNYASQQNNGNTSSSFESAPPQPAARGGYSDPYAQAHTAYAQPTPVSYGDGCYQNQQHDAYEQHHNQPYYPDQARTDHPLDGVHGRKTPKLPSPTDTELTGNLRWDPSNHGYPQGYRQG